MKVAIVTDAWLPQVNGVVRTYENTTRELRALGHEGPVFVCLGRVALEKNIEAFLQLDLPGTKLVIGDGPDLERLRAAYPTVVFTGYRFGKELVQYLAAGDVFVFPSLTDTYGLVMLEAMACGLPVAAFPVTGPVDVIDNGVTGILSDDLRDAALQALHLNPQDCIDFARSRSWRHSAALLAENLAPIQPPTPVPVIETLSVP